MRRKRTEPKTRPVDMRGVPWTESDERFAISDPKPRRLWPLDATEFVDGEWRLRTHTDAGVRFSVRADLAYHVRDEQDDER